VWLYDPPGHVLSQGRWNDSVRVEALTDHLAQWLEVQRINRPVLLGHSLGREVILQLAVRYPQLPAALVAGAAIGIPENPSILRQLKRLIRDIPRERLAFWPLCLSAYVRTGVWRFDQLARAIEHQSAMPFLALVQCRVLLLGGTSDPVVSSGALAQLTRLWPQLQVVELIRAPHAMTDANADAMTEQVYRWVDNLLGSGQV